MNYQIYYDSIIKPFFAPPPWAFGLAWGIIYPLIALSLILLLPLFLKKRIPSWLAAIFILNLIANFAFTPIQLTLGNTFLATIDIFILLATLAVFEWKIYRYSKPIFVLLLPYLLWGTFATILQVSIVVLN